MGFKRDLYYTLLDEIRDNRAVFLLGPRKCGKTIATLQLKDHYGDKAEYVDFKLLEKDESRHKIHEICSAIESGADTIYLLDESTHIYHAEVSIERIALAFNKAKARGNDPHAKVLFTGSQSAALREWGGRSFCNFAKFLYMDFLSYPEWLRYKGRTDITEESYLDYIHGTREFYSDFTTVPEYLEKCLKETVDSNYNSRNIIFGNDCDGITADDLTAALYVTMFTLHNQPREDTFLSNDFLSDELEDVLDDLREKDPSVPDDVLNHARRLFKERYTKVRSLPPEDTRKLFAFLIKSGLLAATPSQNNLDYPKDVLAQLQNLNSIYKNNGELFASVNFTIRYPMFYVEILKEVFREYLPKDLGRRVLGSIMECQVRGLLPHHDSFIYHDPENRGEIDYILLPDLALEITVADKAPQELHFDLFPEGRFRNVLLEHTRRGNWNDIVEIPYYEFVYAVSIAPEAYLREIIQKGRVPGLPAYGVPDDPEPGQGNGQESCRDTGDYEED